MAPVLWQVNSPGILYVFFVLELVIVVEVDTWRHVAQGLLHGLHPNVLCALSSSVWVKMSPKFGPLEYVTWSCSFLIAGFLVLSSRLLCSWISSLSGGFLVL